MTTNNEQPKVYYPITVHELNLIKNDCLFPELDACSRECIAWNDIDGCTFSVTTLVDSVLAREPCFFRHPTHREQPE